jgi:protein-export membrane protein SecD
MLHFPKAYAIFIVIVTLIGVVLALDNFVPESVHDRLPMKLPRIVLGLDLQGGSHMLLAVDANAVRKDRLEALRDDVRRLFGEQPRITFSGLNVNNEAVEVRLREPADAKRAHERLQPLTHTSGTALSLGGGVEDMTIEETQPGFFTLKNTEAGLNERIRKAVDQSIEIVRRRIDQLGTTEPSIQRQGRDRILVQVPGLQDPEQLRRILGQTAKLTFRMVDQTTTVAQAMQGRAPPESEVLPSTDGKENHLVEKRTIISGEDLLDAQPGFDQRTNEAIVSFRFNLNGARRFAAVTTENVGRPFAIILDNKVLSAPVIREPITGGSGQISGQFTPQSANELAVLLRAGALPAPLIPLEERTVGPGLGADSIHAGKIAAIIATVLVASFMLLTYGFLGLLANIALLVHVCFIFAGLSILGATLTLPGIAGIVLTIGMAVDSNVLIYERIREEARAGRSAISAIETGFTRAIGTIWDANITQFIATLVLFFVGTGPVRGFAITLGIGILTTVFTAVTLVRLMVSTWVRVARPTKIRL